jgi:hypothetical protein
MCVTCLFHTAPTELRTPKLLEPGNETSKQNRFPKKNITPAVKLLKPPPAAIIFLGRKEQEKNSID